MVAVSDFSALISGYSWYSTDTVARPIILTYSFEQRPSSYFVKANPAAASTFAPLNEGEKSIVREALNAWSAVSGVTFIETVRHQGDLTFSFHNLNLSGSGNAAGFAYFPTSFASSSNGQFNLYSGDQLVGGDVSFDTDYRASASFGRDFEHVALHEIGHALGLKHPFDTAGGHTNTLTSGADKGTNTVMSYDQTVRSDHLGPLDNAAAQYLYGPATARNAAFSLWDYYPSIERFDAHGTAKAELLRGTGTDDVIYSNGGHDKIYTAQGNDRVVATGQAIDFNGGDGVDTIVTGFAMKSLSDISGSGDYRYILRNGEYEYLMNVERVVFTNGMVALDVQGNAGQAYRLYQAALDRSPDTAGLSWHVNQIDQGLSLHDSALIFISSQEYALRYGGAPSNEAFVTTLYEDAFGRAPDAEGQAYWLGQLAGGSYDKASVLVAFSESPENHARVDPTIAAGILLDYGFMA